MVLQTCGCYVWRYSGNIVFLPKRNARRLESVFTTDTNLSFKKLVEHYQVRWTIEVFIKEAKGLLNLGGCQSSNFDAQIADICA